jgi:hypothetical protein
MDSFDLVWEGTTHTDLDVVLVLDIFTEWAGGSRENGRVG